jgi:hypothetical protein
MSASVNIPVIVSKIKEFEISPEIKKYIKEGVFNPESELFYNNAGRLTQILVFELIFLLENITYSNKENKQLIMDAGYPIFDITVEESLKDAFEGHSYKLKTNICDLLF